MNRNCLRKMFLYNQEKCILESIIKVYIVQKKNTLWRSASNFLKIICFKKDLYLHRFSLTTEDPSPLFILFPSNILVTWVAIAIKPCLAKYSCIYWKSLLIVEKTTNWPHGWSQVASQSMFFIWTTYYTK